MKSIPIALAATLMLASAAVAEDAKPTQSKVENSTFDNSTRVVGAVTNLTQGHGNTVVTNVGIRAANANVENSRVTNSTNVSGAVTNTVLGHLNTSTINLGVDVSNKQ